jgi:DNA-binding CsgD family transcriptional regulator
MRKNSSIALATQTSASNNDKIEGLLEESGVAAAIFSDDLDILFMSSKLKKILAARLGEDGALLLEAIQGAACDSGPATAQLDAEKSALPDTGSGAIDLEAKHAEIRELAEGLASLARKLEDLTSGLKNTGGRLSLADYGLGLRHIEIARLIESGATTKSIARELGLAEATVKSHLSVIYRKTGVEGRAAFIHFLYKNGISLE